MTGILTLGCLMGITCLFCWAQETKPEEYFFCGIATVIAVLYPFYCLDLLRIGRYVVYALFGVVAVFSLWKLCLKRKSLAGNLKEMVSPGVVLFWVLLVFYVLFLHDRWVSLWDELRLWGAVPKALYATERLQMGEEALIFSIMQSYPPAMQLFAYFVTALAPNFPEYQIFLCYAVFYLALIIPSLRNVRWKQWPCLLVLGILLIWLPCLFTSHGGDWGRFYNSLFIDPILGALAGYVLYLSAKEPFRNRLSAYRFCVSLIVLVLIKDSGIMFAIFAGINAGILHYQENKHLRVSKKVLGNGCAVCASILIPQLIWKSLLTNYGVSTGSSSHLHLERLSWQAIGSLLKNLAELPILVWNGKMGSAELSFVPLCALLIYVYIGYFRKDKDYKKWNATLWVMLLEFAAFLLGNCIAFGEKLPSFQRYTSTLLICLLTFLVQETMQVLPDWLEKKFETIKANGTRWKIAGSLLIFVICNCALTVMSCSGLSSWRNRIFDFPEDEQWMKDNGVYQIKANEAKQSGEGSDYYLLIVSPATSTYARVHHRIYFELLDTTAHVRNFYKETNIADEDMSSRNWTGTDVVQAAENWSAKLIDGGYDYVYVVRTDAFADAVMALLGAEYTDEGTVLAIHAENETVTLENCNSN